MRHWFLTNTTYGTWLPGDEHGSVTSVRDRRSTDIPSTVRFEHDLPGTPVEDEIPGLYEAAKEAMKGPPIYLDVEKAETVLAQFLETGGFRGWFPLAIAIMCNHWHMVVQVDGDPKPEKILADFKAYATRALNRKFGRPASETWWTSKGSKRKLSDDEALGNANNYVLYKQPDPLVVWSPKLGRIV